MKNAVQSFIYVASAMSYPFYAEVEDSSIPKNIRTLIAVHGKTAEPFIKEYQLGVPSWNSLIKKLSDPKLSFSDAVNEQGVALAEKIRTKAKKIVGNQELTRNQTEFIKKWQLYMRTDSDSALSGVVSLVGEAHNPELSRLFASSAGLDPKKDNKTLTNQLKDAVKALTGKAANSIPMDTIQKLKVKSPEKVAHYNKVKRELNKLKKEALMIYVRQSGSKTIDIQKAIKYLESNGIAHSLAKDFKGKVDEFGKYYTIYDEPLTGSISNQFPVKMNPNYKKGSTDYVATVDTPASKQYIYTKQTKSTRDQEKFKKATNAANNVKIINRWRKDLNGRKGADRKRMLAALVEIMYLTQIRIGSDKSKTGGKKTYGLTTLRAKHFKPKGKGYRITFLAKSSVKRVMELHPTISGKKMKSATNLVNLITLLLKDKSGDDYVWVDDKGNRIRARDVNSYLKSIGSNITAKYFRTMRGTTLMMQLLENPKLPANPSQKQVMDYFKSSAEKVGEALGHMNKTTGKVTGATAIGNYIDTDIMLNYFSTYNVRPPAALENKKV